MSKVHVGGIGAVEKDDGEDGEETGKVGIAVDDETESEIKPSEAIDRSKERCPRRKRNVILGAVVLCTLIIIAVVVGAALGTQKSTDNLQYDSTTIAVDGLSMDLQGLSRQLSAVAVAVFETTYCRHIKDYFANTGPTKDEMPSLQRNVDITDCSIEVDHRPLRRELDVTSSWTNISFSQKLIAKSRRGLILPRRYISKMPFASKPSRKKLISSLQAENEEYGALTEVGLSLPESSSTCPVPTRLPIAGIVRDTVCSLCPHGFILDQNASSNTPLQGYADAIVSSLDSFVQYKYILAVLAFEPCTCVQIEYMLNSEKLNRLLSGEDWVGEVCDDLQTHLLGMCCMSSSGVLPPAENIEGEEEEAEGYYEPPNEPSGVDFTSPGNNGPQVFDVLDDELVSEPPLVDAPPYDIDPNEPPIVPFPPEDGGREEDGSQEYDVIGDELVPRPALEEIPRDSQGDEGGGEGQTGDGRESGEDEDAGAGEDDNGNSDGDEICPSGIPSKPFKVCADGSCVEIGDFSDCCNEDSCDDGSCPGMCGCGDWNVCADGSCNDLTDPYSCCKEDRCENGKCPPPTCECGKYSCGASTSLCCAYGEHCCTSQGVCTADFHECFCLGVAHHELLYQSHCGR